MSTRATYKIDGVTFYIHHDGYPEGAASYFDAMLKASLELEDCGYERSRYAGGYAEQFLRANDRAEFTHSHEMHGDTEYRYNLDGRGNLTAYKRTSGWGCDEPEFECFYVGPVHEFVNQHGNWEGVCRDWKAAKLHVHMGPIIINKDAAQARLKTKISLLGTWVMNGHDKGCNADNLKAEIAALRAI